MKTNVKSAIKSFDYTNVVSYKTAQLLKKFGYKTNGERECGYAVDRFEVVIPSKENGGRSDYHHTIPGELVSASHASFDDEFEKMTIAAPVCSDALDFFKKLNVVDIKQNVTENDKVFYQVIISKAIIAYESKPSTDSDEALKNLVENPQFQAMIISRVNR